LKVDQSGPSLSAEFTYIDISSVDNKLKRITAPKRLVSDAAPSRAKQLLRAGDVLVSMTRPNLNAVAFVPPEFDGAVGSTGFHVLRANEDTEPRWLYYAVQTQKFISAMSELVQGALYPAVRPKDIRAFEIPNPPLDQQKRIVAEIEKQFSRLDEAVANLKRVKANLKRYKAAVLKAAVEGRLVETEAERARREGRSYETGAQLLQRILETRRSQWQGKGKYKEPAAPDTTDLPELPEGWGWASVDQLAAPEPNSITDGPFGSNLKTEHYQEKGPRVIRLQNIKDGEFADEYAHITQEHFDRLSKHQIRAGDLVIASLGENPPRACIIPSTVGPAIVKADCIRFKPHSRMQTKYINAALNCLPTRQRVKDVLHGIGRPRLSLGEIRSIALPVPPETEQHRIVAEVDRRLSLLRTTEAQVDANLRRAERLRQSILSRAFSGGLVAECTTNSVADGLSVVTEEQ
jgi:type I restriction enzyme S subunit